MRKMGVETFVQVLASAGVLMGLLLVAYELRENRLFAIAEAQRSTIAEWANVSRAQFETDIFEIYIKSIEDPEGLSSSEMLKLGSWLTSTVGLYNLEMMMHEIGLSEDPSESLLSDFQYYLGSRFARAWYQENRDWFTPRMTELIDRELKRVPTEIESGYVRSLRTRIASQSNTAPRN